MSSSVLSELSKQNIRRTLRQTQVYISVSGEPAKLIADAVGCGVRPDEVQVLMNNHSIKLGDPVADNECYDPKGCGGGSGGYVRRVTWVG